MPKKELLQVFQDFSEQYGDTYEQRAIFDSEFGDLADALLKKPSTAIDLIAAERERQIKVEGWTKEHDAQHTDGQLANAACAYAMTEDMVEFINDEWGNDMFLNFWP